MMEMALSAGGRCTGPGEFRDVGMNDKIHADMIKHVGKAASDKRYLDYIHTYSFNVKRLDPNVFEEVQHANDPGAMTESGVSGI